MRRRSGARAAPPCVRSRLARGGRGRSRACRMRALGECRGGEESGRRTHPDVRVQVIALRVYARYLMCDGFALKGGGAICTPRPPPLPPPMARVSRERACPFGPIRTEAHPTGPRACSRADRLRALAFAARARASHAAAVSTTPRRSGAARCAGVRDASRTPPLRCRLSENIAKSQNESRSRSTAFRVRSSLGVGAPSNSNLYGNQSLRSANPYL